MIRRIKYDATAWVLEITFTTDRVYVYCNVPEKVYRALLDATSKGTFFNERIRDVFPNLRKR